MQEDFGVTNEKTGCQMMGRIRFDQLPNYKQQEIIAAHEQTQQGIARFSIYRQPTSAKQCQEEAAAILHLLLRLDTFFKLDYVRHGVPQNEPDFIFEYSNGKIGVELTELIPKQFEFGGHRQKKDFSTFEKQNEEKLPLEASFQWESRTSRESLAAMAEQLRKKQLKAKSWCDNFSEIWLLMHISRGGPFGEVVADERNMRVESDPGAESDFKDHLAKVTSSIYRICTDAAPFDFVIPFMGGDLIAFPTSSANSHGLPIPCNELVNRGAPIPDSFLDRKIKVGSSSRRRWLIPPKAAPLPSDAPNPAGGPILLPSEPG